MRACLWIALVVGLANVASAQTATLKIRSRHEYLKLRSGTSERRYIWLKSEETLLLRVSGPTNVGLQVRKLMLPGQAAPPVDLTVVRDDQEQGTVRFRLPQPDGAAPVGREDLSASGEVLVKIEIPAGEHTYRVLAGGPRQGILVSPRVGIISRERVVVATPGKTRTPDVAISGRVPARRPVTKPDRVAHPPRPRPEPVPPDILPAVPSLVRREKLFSLEPAITQTAPSGLGPGTRVSMTAAGMLLTGTVSLLVAGMLIEGQAEDEPIQIPAGALLDRAERSYQAAAVLGGLAATAVVATLLFYFLEEPDREQGEGSPSVFSLRF